MTPVFTVDGPTAATLHAGSIAVAHGSKWLLRILHSDGEDDAGIARYILASFAIAGNFVLCIVQHSQRSK